MADLHSSALAQSYALILTSTCLSALFLAITYAIWVSASDYRPGKRGKLRRSLGPNSATSGKASTTMPDSLQRWIEGESEEWARDEMRAEANRLQSMTEDWGQTEVLLREQYASTDMPPDIAANVAWSQASTNLVDDTQPQE